MAVGVLTKDPNETAWFTMDWTRRLEGEALIATSTWTLPTGLTQAGDAITSDNYKASVLVSGGTSGTDYVVVNQITTNNSQTLRRTGVLAVRDL